MGEVFSLLDFFQEAYGDDWLIVVDESHISFPKINMPADLEISDSVTGINANIILFRLTVDHESYLPKNNINQINLEAIFLVLQQVPEVINGVVQYSDYAIYLGTPVRQTKTESL